MTPIDFADLTSARLAGLLAGTPPVLLLPVGAIEPHGPHAPVGTDPLISSGMCRRAALRLNSAEHVRVLVLPPLPYGVTRCADGFAGAVHISAGTLAALLTDVAISVARQGFHRMIVVNNHFEPEQVRALRDTVRDLRAAQGLDVELLDLLRRERVRRLTAEFRSGECHAGRYETSLVLADAPGLVDRHRMRTLPRVPVNLAEAMRDGRRDFRDLGMPDAYCGSPAEATAREGETSFQILTDLLVELLDDE